jgi:hypothetical protein
MQVREAMGSTLAVETLPFVRGQQSATKCNAAKNCYHTCASVDDTTPMNFFDVAAFGRCGHLSGRVLAVGRYRMALMVVR